MSTEILTGPTGAGGLDPPRLAATSFKDGARKVGRPIVFGLLVLAAWELAIDIYGIRPTLLPPPSQIFREMVRNREILLLNAVPTTVETVAGFLLSVVLGGLLGILLSYSRFARETLYPNVILFQLIPKVAVAPLFMVWLGIDWQARVSIALFIAFFPIVISTTAGLNAVDPALLRLCRSLTATQWQTFIQVRLPASLPFIFNGMKISMTFALIGVIVAEFITSHSGLGYIILFAGSQLNTPIVMAAIIILCVVGLLLYGCVAVSEHLIMRKYGS
jgi:NitT/TauT family transport system permease protein